LGRRRVIHPDPGVKVIAPSEFLANRIRREGVAVHEVLRNFVPDHGYDPNQRSAEANTLLYLGLLERHKGVHVLVDAFCRSSDEHGFRLLIVGDGNLREELRMMVRRAGMDERVAITGHLRREEVEGLRKKVAAQIVPSTWYENAPLTVLEAFSFGIPVIASDIGGLGEIAVQEAGSETFRSGDNLELSERIIELWSHKESLRERSRMAREAYVKRFSPDVHIASYVRIINDLQSK
jgi:glycosyltransferase involved in cell wall biosynthesis